MSTAGVPGWTAATCATTTRRATPPNERKWWGAKIIFVLFNTDERYSYLRARHCSQCGIFAPSEIPFARDLYSVRYNNPHEGIIEC